MIEWHQVYQWPTDTAVTFQLVLFPDGDIRFHYLEMPADMYYAVVGIENQDGSDGLMYWEGETAWGTPVERALVFERPDPSERGKITPMLQGGFTYSQGSLFDFVIENNGDSSDPSSAFTIKPVLSDPNWVVAVLDEDGNSLPDIDSDGKYETGSILKGASLPLRIQLAPPQPTQAGDYLEVGIRLATLNESYVITATLQSAVPLPFGQIYYQPPAMLMLEGFWKHGSYAANVADYMPGNNSPSLMRNLAGLFAASWPAPCISIGCQSSIYANTDIMLSLYNGEIPARLTTTTVSDSGDIVVDPNLSSNVYNPLMASTSDGQIGLLWQHWLYDYSTHLYNSNIEFGLADGSGELVLEQPLSVSQDISWGNLPRHLSPRLVSTTNDRFIAFWLEEYEETGLYFQRIYYRLLDANGGLLTDPYLLVNSQDYGAQFTDLNAAAVNGNQAMVLFSLSSGGTSQPVSLKHLLGENIRSAKTAPLLNALQPAVTGGIRYLIVDDDGGAPVVEWTTLADGDLDNPRAVQNDLGSILVAWSSNETKSVDYLLLNSSIEPGGAVQVLNNLDGRLMDGISLTSDADGNFILTAMNSEWQDDLYYAALDDVGGLLTPKAMVFKTDPGGNYYVFSGQTGQQNAPYEGGYPLYMPLIRR